MKGRSVHLESSKNKLHMLALIDLATLTDDCNGCYTISGTVQCTMHSVTTSNWQNVQKLSEVFKLSNRNMLWSFLLLPLLVTSFRVRNFIIPSIH